MTPRRTKAGEVGRGHGAARRCRLGDLRRGAMWAAAVALIWTCLAIRGGAASAEDAAGHTEVVALTNSYAPISNDDPDTEIARFGLEAAPWVAGAINRLAAMRSDNAEPRQVVLLGDDDEDGYLAVSWRGDDGWSVEIFVADPGAGDEVRLRQVSTIVDVLVQIVGPTGTRPFPRLPPVLAVAHSCMCSGDEGSIRIILLVGDTIDITPQLGGTRHCHSRSRRRRHG